MRWGTGASVAHRWAAGLVSARARQGVVAGVLGLGLLSLASCVADPPPQIGTAIAANTKVLVAWEAPVGDNALGLTSYVVTPYVGSVAQAPVSFSASARFGTVTGLTNGVTYTFSVRGINARGHGTARSARSNPVTPSIGAAVSVETGMYHTCALMTTGAVECWGTNTHGQLGDGTTASTSSPVLVIGIDDAVAISAGAEHTCALLASADVVCWGYNDFARVGNVPVTNVTQPLKVEGLEGATSIDAGETHTCAVVTDGAVKCWGYNGNGQLGNGSVVHTQAYPTPVVGLDSAVAVTAGPSSTCAVLVGGGAACWGDNSGGQLGTGYVGGWNMLPAPVAGLAGVASLTAGRGHTCALVAGGVVKCWGGNEFGQLGNGLTDGQSKATPAAVLGISNAVAVTAGTSSCALLATGSGRCWGWNGHGQLGNGTTTSNAVPVPVAVTSLSGATDISNSHMHTCAVVANGAVSCWGWNGDGRLGAASPFQSPTPIVVSGL
jgi:alpha-tubulin suppressor-like RCC1 family protein